MPIDLIDLPTKTMTRIRQPPPAFENSPAQTPAGGDVTAVRAGLGRSADLVADGRAGDELGHLRGAAPARGT